MRKKRVMKTRCEYCPYLIDLSTLAGICYRCRKNHPVCVEYGTKGDDIQKIYSEDCNE